jgi:hypothetical protein
MDPAPTTRPGSAGFREGEKWEQSRCLTTGFRLTAIAGPTAPATVAPPFPGFSKDGRLDTPQGALRIRGDSDTEF